MESKDLYVILLLVQVALAIAVDVQVLQMKAIGNSDDKFRLTGRCEYITTGLDRPVAAEAVRFKIQLDRPSSKFKSSQATELSTDGSTYWVTNKKAIKSKKFKVTFTCEVQYNDTMTTKCFPVGICTALLTETTTTSSTTTLPTTTDPGIGTNVTELLENSDMENDFTGNWFCIGCTLESSNDSYSGNHSAKITNRDLSWKGLSQSVNLTAGSRYGLSGFVKLLNTENGALYHKVELVLFCDNVTENAGGEKFIKFGTNLMVQPHIWTEIGAVLPIPEGFTTFKVYVQVYGVTADYLVDHMSMHEVPDIMDWKLKAEANIEQIRKADISIRVISSNPLPDNLTLEVNQTKHEFAFGSAVGATQIVDDTDPTLQKYQTFFYDNFEWAVLENALKWKPMERVEGIIDYDRPLTAINALRSRGIKIRGHNVFWGVEKNLPEWVKSLNQADLLAAITTRINGVIGNTTGLCEQLLHSKLIESKWTSGLTQSEPKSYLQQQRESLEHWDVNNENQHGDFFERKTGDANITMQMFRDVNAIDPDAKLFLNDFGIIETRGNQKATAIKEQARLFKAANLPIHGIGVQSHIKNSDLDVTAMKVRLDKLAEVGIPIWITELSMEESNENKKAEALEDVLTLYFSHPAVEGVLLWGFWDGKIFKENASLVEGPDLTPNAAGRAYQRLFKETWRSSEFHDVNDTNPVVMRGFKGEYSAKLKTNDILLKSVNFTLGNAGATVDILLS